MRQSAGDQREDCSPHNEIYDIVAIAEAPNDAAMVKWLFAFNRNGYRIAETLRGSTSDEFIKLIDEIKDLPQ